ncbi:MAG: hypothetical protein GX935_02015 [Erysipelotrichia bacterium]|nr:hypothetical protein [Erysipelotrichia bacterium]
METLDQLIIELIKLQKQGKGHYKVVDGEDGEPLDLFVVDEAKRICF